MREDRVDSDSDLRLAGAVDGDLTYTLAAVSLVEPVADPTVDAPLLSWPWSTLAALSSSGVLALSLSGLISALTAYYSRNTG